jgi:hypothetical protein
MAAVDRGDPRRARRVPAARGGAPWGVVGPGTFADLLQTAKWCRSRVWARRFVGRRTPWTLAARPRHLRSGAAGCSPSARLPIFRHALLTESRRSAVWRSAGQARTTSSVPSRGAFSPRSADRGTSTRDGRPYAQAVLRPHPCMAAMCRELTPRAARHSPLPHAAQMLTIARAPFMYLGFSLGAALGGFSLLHAGARNLGFVCAVDPGAGVRIPSCFSR